MKLEKGTTISHYKILSKIGSGGMGEVYLAEDTKLDRQVALKILPVEFAEDKDRMSRFVREAKSASALNHPNIITIYEIGESDGTNYIATEFIDGKTLGEYAKDNTLNYNSALDIANQVASALDVAHSNGIVHRDIKPDNVMIRPDGFVKILDFGIAKLSEPPAVAGGLMLDKGINGENEELQSSAHADGTDPEAATAIQSGTMPGMIIGTANYMSPEQAKGEVVDARTDIFSFGVVLYEMIAGHLPFEGKAPMEIIGAIIHKEPKPLDAENIPTEIEKIISKTLRKNRNERYQTIKGLLADLKEVKQELEFQDKLEKNVSPNEEEPKTQILKAAETIDEPNQTATNENQNDSITIKKAGIGKAAIGIFTVLMISAIAIGYWFYSGSNSKQIESIAVMPFVNESDDEDVEYLSDGMTETLIYRLSQINNLKVSPTSSVYRYKGKQTDSVKAGNELGVEAVITGRIAQRGDDLIVSIELVDIRNSKMLWGERYNRKMSDLLATQKEITTEVIQKLKLKLTGKDQKELQRNYTADNEAYQLYLKGKYQYNRETKAAGEKGIEYFKEAIKLDPNFALAYVGIADIYLSMASWGYFAPIENEKKAKAAAQKALEIDPNLAEAHAAAAWHAAILEWDWQKAEREYKKAIELDPNIAQIHHNYCFTYLLPMSRTKEALVESKRALELEPLSLLIGSQGGLAYMFDGQLDKALEQIEATAKLDPGYVSTGYYLGVIYIARENYDKAIALVENRLEKEPNDQLFLEIAGYAYAKAGQRRKAEEIIERFGKIAKTQYVMRSSVAPIYVALGEKDKAITELEKAYEVRDPFLLEMNIHPYFKDIRDDPRFVDIVKRIGLPVVK